MNDDREPGDGDLVEGDDKRPVPDHVQEAVRTLLAWAGEDPSREGLLDTPARVGRAWKEYCRGYEEDPSAHLSRTFSEVGGYRSEEHTSELQSLMRISYAVFCLKKKNTTSN